MARQSAPVHYSASTWQQPVPPAGSPERAALLTALAARVTALGQHRLRVAVDGFTAAGKTSFGHELAARVAAAGRPVLRACLDDFKHPWRDRHRYDRESGEGYYRNAFDYAAVTALLLDPAAPDGSGQCVLCARDPLTQADHTAERTPIPPDGVLLVDGVFALRPELDRYWDLRVWLDVDAERSVRRGTARDGADGWAGANAESVHRDRYLVAERLYLAEADPVERADVVVDNRDFARPRLLRG